MFRSLTQRKELKRCANPRGLAKMLAPAQRVAPTSVLSLASVMINDTHHPKLLILDTAIFTRR
jgi:hypothetical protein